MSSAARHDAVAAGAAAPGPRLRLATRHDLPAINAVIKSALAGWALPERVVRLATPLFEYQDQDLADMSLLAAQNEEELTVGVAAWEFAPTRDSTRTALMLYGLFVAPAHQRRGLGSLLLGAVYEQAARKGSDFVRLRAWREAVAFLRARGFAEPAVCHHDDHVPRDLARRVA